MLYFAYSGAIMLAETGLLGMVAMQRKPLLSGRWLGGDVLF